MATAQAGTDAAATAVLDAAMTPTGRVDAPRRVLVVGGVGGGASAAARLRRMDETAEIVVFERGEHASFANCGLPYFVGGEIKDESKLLVATPTLFRERFNIHIRTRSEVVRLDPDAKTLTVRGPSGTTVERYDACVLATGAAPLKLPIKGLDGPGVFSLRSIPDSRAIRTWIERTHATHATVVGAGFAGVELVHALRGRGIDVALVELAPHPMSPMDDEFAVPIEAELIRNGVELFCGEAVTEVRRPGSTADADTTLGSDTGTCENGRVSGAGGAGAGAAHAAATAAPLQVVLRSGKAISTHLVLVVAGARPESSLAVAAGLSVTSRGAIVVDSHMRTSVEGVWAVGDVVQSYRVLDHHGTVVPLAGIANRQGRVAAESIAGVASAAPMREVQGTGVVRVFDLTLAMTGAMEKTLRREPDTWPPGSYHIVHTHPGHHASYFPGASPMHLKLAFAAADGRVLGAQAVGSAHEAVARRIDVISTVIQMRGTVRDLAAAELCYAPQYGSAKDPVNVIGMLATNVLNGHVPLSDWKEVMASAAAVEAGNAATMRIIDVRTAAEFKAGHIPGAEVEPLETLRERVSSYVERHEPVHVVCRVGQRAYVAVRLLRQRGCDARLVSGGYQTYLQLQPRGVDGYRDVVEEYLRQLDA